MIIGGEGNDYIWGGNWFGDNVVDIFVFVVGSGKDIIYDFEVIYDQIDLWVYGLNYEWF